MLCKSPVSDRPPLQKHNPQEVAFSYVRHDGDIHSGAAQEYAQHHPPQQEERGIAVAESRN